MRSKSVLGYRRKSSLYRVRDNDPQNQRVATSGYQKPGSRGLPLVFFPPTFFKESRAPPPESAGPPGALRPEAGKSPDHP